MTRYLLTVAILAGLAAGGPARAQYVFLDVNGDGLNSQTDGALPADRLDPSVTSVDVYYVTDKNRDGSPAACSTSTDPFSMITYEFILHAWGPGTVTFGSWTDNLGFGYGLVSCGDGIACPIGGDVWVGKGTPLPLSPGKYRVGSLTITVTGTPALDFIARSGAFPTARTSFGSECLGSNFNNTPTLGDDFSDSDGTEAPSPALATLWGKIKALYR